MVSKALILGMILGLGIIMYSITMSEDNGTNDVSVNTPEAVTTAVPEPDPNKTWIDNVGDFFTKLVGAWDK